ncbi:TIGR03617 family F420-dependent LLM class oxidoreductase [Rhodococcus koreensis]|uniref:TIGR03617 family F420-dependent LLM class oxidoreductase n=1 Tax=Rhodococcus koreensis TaxID=99653 RepID=UPI0036707032
MTDHEDEGAQIAKVNARDCTSRSRTLTMEIDFYPGSGLRLDEAETLARTVESSGIGGLWALEAAREPFGPLAVAALATTRLHLRTAVAVAFARNPMILAQQAHELARVSSGRFVLGIGTQVRAHVARRFSEEWSHPGRRMAEYIAALRAIWRSWNEQTPLDFNGEFYRHTLMTPMFDPGPSGQAPPPIHLAAVGPTMVRIAAEHADGLVLHPLSSRRSITENVLPIIGGRCVEPGFELSCPVLVITGTTDNERDSARAAVRKQIAFYASTPAYRRLFELYDEGDRADELQRLAREGHWDDMTALITDDLLDEFSIDAHPAELRARIEERFCGVVNRVAIYAPYSVDLQSISNFMGPGALSRNS